MNSVQLLRPAVRPEDWPETIAVFTLTYRTEDPVADGSAWEFTIPAHVLPLIAEGDILRSDHNFGSFGRFHGQPGFRWWESGQWIDPRTGRTLGYEYRGPARRVGWSGEEGIGGRV
jgi:hypothetical protein